MNSTCHMKIMFCSCPKGIHKTNKAVWWLDIQLHLLATPQMHREMTNLAKSYVLHWFSWVTPKIVENSQWNSQFQGIACCVRNASWCFSWADMLTSQSHFWESTQIGCAISKCCRREHLQSVVFCVLHRKACWCVRAFEQDCQWILGVRGQLGHVELLRRAMTNIRNDHNSQNHWVMDKKNVACFWLGKAKRNEMVCQ